jgi:hypothetical protein
VGALCRSCYLQSLLPSLNGIKPKYRYCTLHIYFIVPFDSMGLFLFLTHDEGLQTSNRFTISIPFSGFSLFQRLSQSLTPILFTVQEHTHSIAQHLAKTEGFVLAIGRGFRSLFLVPPFFPLGEAESL